jgi:hypothetical protein
MALLVRRPRMMTLRGISLTLLLCLCLMGSASAKFKPYVRLAQELLIPGRKGAVLPRAISSRLWWEQTLSQKDP